jgi:ribonucleoside-diphosphate reductase alpha chain
LSSSGGFASGPVSFLHLFNQLVETVKHGNSRKGAMKADLGVSHPDIYEFIHCKDDTTQLNNMNISVSISDRFMNAVINNLDWNLVYKDKVYRTVKAKDLWQEIITSAWRTGEPGLTFIDIADRANMNPHLGHIKGSNPCLHKDTYMVTENGLERISKLKSSLWNGNEYSQSKSWMTGVKPVVKLMTNSGFEYIVTPDHKFMLDDGSWCEAKDTIGKEIKFDISEKNWLGNNPHPEANYEVLGFEFGDGNYHKASGRMKYIYVTEDKDIEVQTLIEKEFDDKFYRNSHDGLMINIPYGTIYASAFEDKIENRLIPDWIMQLSKAEMAYFLRGLFSANGCNLKKYHRITLVSVNKDMLKQVQQMLLLFGIKAKLWYHSKKQDIEFSNGVYECKQSCHLVISRESYVKFLDKIGFIQSYKNGHDDHKFKEEDDTETVILIEELDEAEVWDFTEPIHHYAITNGAYVHNCQEFINIPYSSCNLGSINLAECVTNGKLDNDKLERLVRLGIRFIDDMITVNKLPLPKIQQVTEEIRPVGLGTMGLADMLFKLRIPMNKPEGINFLNKLYAKIKDIARNEDTLLSMEKGVYPKWEGSVWQTKHGRPMRNSNLLSIAPNGSIGFIANVNGGVEPVFSLVYTRRTQEGHEYFVVNEVFKQTLIDEGLYSDELLQKIINNNGSVQGLKEIPQWMQDVFVTAMDMSPEEHLACLNVVSKHVDLSVSKTINLPNDATVNDVSKVYLEAWKLGAIKGTTVYRTGSRQDQVLSVKKEEPKPEPIGLQRGDWAPLTDDIVYYKRKLRIGCGSLKLFLGWSDTDKIIQDMYVVRSGQGGCEKTLQSMVIAMSAVLRLGGNLGNIEKAFSGVSACPSFVGQRAKGQQLSSGSSCGMAILNEIKLFLKERECQIDLPVSPRTIATYQLSQETQEKDKCPECGEELIHEGGCVQCSCGFSKCG